MAMTWTTLTAAKGQPGAIATWAAYSKLDTNPILDEAQALLYMHLRILEMQTSVYLNLGLGAAELVLPSNFLEPIGDLICPSINRAIRHRDTNFVNGRRSYTESTSTLGTNPLTTTAGATAINVNLPNHGFTPGGGNTFTISGATSVGGITPNGAYNITAIIDANDFTIDNPNAAPVAVSSATGGGSAVVYLADILTQGIPQFFAVAEGAKVIVDYATSQALNIYLRYFSSLPLLSATNLSNVLTNRYPQLLRRACLVAAAEFMDDDAAVQRLMQNQTTGLIPMIQRVNQENERYMSGMEIVTETPGTGWADY